MVTSSSPTPARSATASRWPRVVWSAAAAVLVAVTTAVVVADGPLPGEVAIVRWLQGLPAGAIVDVIRLTTGTEGNLVVGALPGVWLTRRHGRAGAAAVAICLLAMLVVQPVAKDLVDRERPTAAQVEVRAGHASESYPSGHSLSTATVWGAASLYAVRGRHRVSAAALAVPIVATAVASGVSGVHWPSDSLAGTIVGAAAAWVAIGRVRPRDATGAGARP